MGTIFSSREFNQDTGRAKKAAREGPVFITERGETSHVLLSVDDYRKLTEKQASIVDLLFMPDVGEIDLELPERTIWPMRVPDFS